MVVLVQTMAVSALVLMARDRGCHGVVSRVSRGEELVGIAEARAGRARRAMMKEKRIVSRFGGG